jgi:hypothetical protein
MSYRRLFDEDRRRDAVEHLTGRAHPGTEQGTVRSFLMMRVLRLMRNRLGGCQTADHKDAENQETGEGTFDRKVFHILQHIRTGKPMVLDRAAESQENHRAEVFVFQIGFTIRFRYTDEIFFGNMTLSTGPFTRNTACSHRS